GRRSHRPGGFARGAASRAHRPNRAERQPASPARRRAEPFPRQRRRPPRRARARRSSGRRAGPPGHLLVLHAEACRRGRRAGPAGRFGFRLWEAKRYTEAQKSLEATAKRYPKSKWASWASNLAGRAYLDAGKPATAAKTFLANYQGNPKGERAADSLYFLGQALVALDKPADACKAYDELQDVYGSTMRDWLKQRLPAARTQARCR
ncbi:MAG TPA: tetratricopeptide repeat protein, partial [Allosphingosinicella sp.]|nr:tetratricopeptide repeat protein [Allosphingosinicella sp.]